MFIYMCILSKFNQVIMVDLVFEFLIVCGFISSILCLEDCSPLQCCSVSGIFRSYKDMAFLAYNILFI